MKDSVVWPLILKDWHLQRPLIAFSIMGGALALALVQRGGEGPMVVGSVWFFIALILAGTLLPFGTIVNERKKQNLAFVMSLPVSPMQYTTSKLLSTVGIFLVPWLTLVAGALLLIEVRHFAPQGGIPLTLILAGLPFIGLSFITAAALIGESEGWGIAANVFCSSTYGLVWYFMTRIPGLKVNMNSPVPVWNSTVLTILGLEFGLIVLMLGLTYYFQSRKRDFI